MPEHLTKSELTNRINANPKCVTKVTVIFGDRVNVTVEGIAQTFYWCSLKQSNMPQGTVEMNNLKAKLIQAEGTFIWYDRRNANEGMKYYFENGELARQKPVGADMAIENVTKVDLNTPTFPEPSVPRNAFEVPLNYFPFAGLQIPIRRLPSIPAMLHSWIPKEDNGYVHQEEQTRRVMSCLIRQKAVLLKGHTGTGKCIDKNSLVWHNNGIKRIGRFAPNQMQEDSSMPLELEVKSFDEKLRLGYKKTSSLYYSGIKDAHIVTTDMGYRHIVSMVHPLYAYHGGGFKFMKADEMTTDTWLPMILGEGILDIPTTVKIGSRKIAVDADFGYFMGQMVGDGHIYKGNTVGKYQTRITTTDPETIAWMKSYLNSHLGRTMKSYAGDPITYCISRPKALHQFLASEYMAADKKQFPDCILDAGQTAIIGFLQGLFDSDGTVCKRSGYPSFSTNSICLADDVQRVLLVLGIRSARRKRNVKCNSKRFTSYEVSICADARIFRDLIGFRLPRKQEVLSLLSAVGNANLQCYPPFVMDEMKRLFDSAKERGIKKDRNLYIKWQGWTLYKRTPSREKLAQFVKELNVPEDNILSRILRQRIFFLKVVSVEKTIADLYDFVVPETHTFIANGFLNHNTELLRSLAYHTGNPFIIIPCSGDMETSHLLGYNTVDAEGSIIFVEGLLTTAVRHGAWVYFDEFNAMSSDITTALNPLLDGSRCLVLTENKGAKVPMHENFRFVASGNPATHASYAGTKVQNLSLVNRMTTIMLDYLDEKNEEKVLVARFPSVRKEYIDRLVRIGNEVRKLFKLNNIQAVMTTRDLIDLLEDTIVLNQAHRDFDNAIDDALASWIGKVDYQTMPRPYTESAKST